MDELYRVGERVIIAHGKEAGRSGVVTQDEGSIYQPPYVRLDGRIYSQPVRSDRLERDETPRIEYA
jgi:hypothetical protein